MKAINYIPIYSTKIQVHYVQRDRLVLKLDNWTHRVHVHGIEALLVIIFITVIVSLLNRLLSLQHMLTNVGQMSYNCP